MTIKRYLLIVILSSIVLATFSAALQGFKASNQKLNFVFDGEMRSIAFTLKNSPIAPSDFDVDTHSSFAFQIWKADKLIVKSKNAPSQKIANSTEEFGYRSFLGNHWRYFSLLDEHSHVIVAQPMPQRIESIEEVLLEAVLPIVIVIPIIGLIVYSAVNKALSPIRTLSESVMQKDASDLTPINIEANTTDLEPIQNTINGLLERLNAAFEREKSLASNAAHELRTPISVLKLNAHNLKIAFEAESIKEQNIDDLTANTERMAHVIEQVIALNRTTPENFDAKKTQFNISNLLQEVIASNFSKIDSQGQSVSLNATSMSIFADKFSLETLFDNLIKNAIKYSGIGAEILISATRNRDNITISVEDSGPGIHEDQLDKVMQRFYRVKHHEQTGSGLGLSIVSHIVALHKGNVTLGRSSLGGLRVDIVLPHLDIGNIDAG
ncbi:sensor histidine kinase [Thalassotalea piscium]|uniref:histidine kinase n=1 Tax=Thalassotalea piscium TaxID=1230533 RepID=A0A7X0TS13_9GAMM|nr:HAMP domain-containing sensor histidine kinase [Thalassotalea piscium]MBB6541678.1 two-component system sensor histidine kinase QseC [Thalassotalea piscium]